MPWVEKRRNGWIVRSQKDGKVTSHYFDDESEARYYARMGKPFPITSAGIINQLQESTGKPRKKRSPKLGDYALEVIAHDTNIGQGSRDAYAATIRNHVVDSVIDVPITDVEPAMVRRFYSGLRPTKNYAAAGNGMRSSVIRVLSKVFKQAVNDGIIPSSPLSRSGVKRPSKRRSVPIQAMSIDDIEELADCAPSTRNHLAILLAGLCGLRAGEVGGLRVRDVDFSKCRLSVSQAVYRDRTGRHVGAPKTAASRRTITIPCSLSKELAKFVKGKPRGDLIFQTEVGGLVDHVVLGKWVKQAAKACGIEVHTHLLRHACASLLIDSGANPRQVQQYLGHSDIGTTLGTYAHLFDSAGTDLADRMEARRQDYQKRVSQLDI
jgi:integrase